MTIGMVDEHFEALREATSRVRTSAATIQRWGQHLGMVLGGGGRLLVCGNGGSAAEAQHLTGELVGRFLRDRPPFSAIALHADTSAITAVINDYGEHEVFAREVRAHGRPGDVLLALSTSGSSHNVVAAAKTARATGLTAWALTGPAPNVLAAQSDDAITVDASSAATVQELHLAIVHALCAVFDDTLDIAARPPAQPAG